MDSSEPRQAQCNHSNCAPEVTCTQKKRGKKKRKRRREGDEHRHHWNASQVEEREREERKRESSVGHGERESECLHLRFARVVFSMCSLFTFHSTLQVPSDQSSKATTRLNELRSGGPNIGLQHGVCMSE